VDELLKKFLFPVLALLVGLTVPYLMAEGVYSLAKGPTAATSLAYDTYSTWFVDRRVPPYDPSDPTTQVITNLAQFKSHMDAFKAERIGIGNSPFHGLKTTRVALNDEENGCKVQKPNLHKIVAYVRSNLFNPFDQITYFHDVDQQLSPELERFFDRYQFRPVHHTTNQYGERLTLPVVESENKVLVAGDSVANGVMLDDSETIASQLQAMDPTRQYVNLGISGATSSDIQCALEKAATRYAGQIRELIYVFCENDFIGSNAYGTPEDLVAWLVNFKNRVGIDRVLLQYAPYIYNIVPQVTRVRGNPRRNFPTFRNEKRRLLSAAREAGFGVIDYVDIAKAEEQAVGSQFAPLALFVDHAHLSPVGIQRLLPRYAALRQSHSGDD
jgi:hypothetical protein